MTYTPSTRRIVSATREIAAPPETIFELLARPAGHSEIAGYDTVKSANTSGPARLTMGSKFVMKMKIFGVPYGISNEVVAGIDVPEEDDDVFGWGHGG